MVKRVHTISNSSRRTIVGYLTEGVMIKPCQKRSRKKVKTCFVKQLNAESLVALLMELKLLENCFCRKQLVNISRKFVFCWSVFFDKIKNIISTINR